MKEWIDDCENNHSGCQIGIPLSFDFPARLIDVGPLDNLVDPLLVETTTLENPTRTVYVALSHCWGDGALTKTLDSNVLRYSEKIPVQELSNTFREAMKITRELGVRYIWIDSLCIIQNDAHDWSREAAKMATVF